MDAKTEIERISKEAHRFRDSATAASFHDRCSRPMRMVHGDDETVWVVMPADAARLDRLGYEIVG